MEINKINPIIQKDTFYNFKEYMKRKEKENKLNKVKKKVFDSSKELFYKKED